MNKTEIDTFFQKNHREINAVICRFQSLSRTKTNTSVLSDIYLECLNKHNASMPLIQSLACNMYRFSRSKHNKQNRCLIHGDVVSIEEVSHILTIPDEVYVDSFQEFEYICGEYLLRCSNSDRIFFDIYVNKGIRTVREVAAYLNITHYAAHELIKTFKFELMNGKAKMKRGSTTQPEQVETVEQTQPIEETTPKPKATRKTKATMKKLIILLSIFAFSCKKETPQPTQPKCECRIITQNELQGYPGYWEDEPAAQPVNDGTTDCDKHGEVIQTWTTTNWLGVRNHRKIYRCE